ncbi:MAG: hypothetical protein ACLRS8_18100 [Parabacteroides merdae]
MSSGIIHVHSPAYNVIPGVKGLRHLYLETGHWTYPEQQSERIEWLKDKCGK